jgi:sulfite reductase (NADPH) flavoprotein alpha-component
MNAPLLPGPRLTPEQRQLLEHLSRSLDAEQSRWVSGYFAGLAAGVERVEVATTPGGRRSLTILYGTETGNCAELARALAASASDKGLSPSLHDMADYKARHLADAEDLLIVVSTYGEGDPPQPAAGFFDYIEGRKAPKLPNTRFAVLALGDSTYERYCEAGKRLDRRCEELGAERLLPRVDCDIDYEEPAASWMRAVLEHLSADAPQTAPVRAAVAAITPAALYGKRNPFPGTVIDNFVLVGRGSTKETRHVEISLAGSGLSYEPGDALGIAATNAQGAVDNLLAALGFESDLPVFLKGETPALGVALRDHFEITTATPRFLDQWTKLTDATELRRLREPEHAGERAAFLATHHVVDIVRRFPLKLDDAQDFLVGLRPLQPRLYSIASSLSAAPDEAHLTIAPVRYDLHGEPRAGVASDQLAGRSPIDAQLPVYVQSNPHFRLPADDAPIIMIGAGTGIAPYRGFLQEREARGGTGRAWLFFGERNFRTDFLYQIEWQSFLKDGVLTRMDVAFSRDDAEKVYVQQRMRERSADLYAWLEEGAHVYVCGDAAHLAPDVHEALLGIVIEQGRISRDAAEDYVRALAGDHRYQRDVY